MFKKLFNKSLRILLFTNGLVLTASAMLGPIYALFVEKVGGDLLEASSTFAVYNLTAVILTFIFGKFADKIKEEELVVVLGYLILGIGFLGYLFVNSIWSLLLVQVIIGLGEAVYGPAFDACYSKHLEKGKYAAEWGIWEGLNYLTKAIGALIGGILANSFGFNYLFIFMALLCFISAFYIFLLPRKLI